MTPGHILRSLVEIDHAGRFAVSGQHPDAPLVHIDDLGTLPLPIVPVLLPALRAAGEPAPYGRGPDTLVDPDVRRCHQLDADQVDVPDSFMHTLADIVEEAARGLGVDGPVRAHLYKLLVYGPGDFFVPHRDTEKEAGMFGTLVITLPGEFAGGELVVRHGAEEERVPLQSEARGLQWTAFYADCTHEVRPLEHGVRVALVYNLVRQGAPTGPARDHRAVERIADELRSWTEDDPVKLAIVLDHRYSQAELGWDRLKGADHGRAMVLRLAARAAGVTAHLALLSIDIEWSAEELQYRYGRRRRWRGFDEPDQVPDDLELYDEVRDERVLRDFIDASGDPTELEPLPLEEGEVWPDGAIDDERPDDLSYYEATGNEGATLTRMYRRSVVVLWPPHSADALVAQRGLGPVAEALAGCEDDERIRRMVERVLPTVALASGATVAPLLDVLAIRGLGRLARSVVEQRRHLSDDELRSIGTLVEALPEPQAASLTAVALQAIGRWAIADAMELVQRVSRSAQTPKRWRPALDRVVQLLGERHDLVQVPSQLVEMAWGLRHAGLQRALLVTLDRDEGLDQGARLAVELHRRGSCPEPWRQPVVSRLQEATRTAPVAPSDLQRAPVQGCRCTECRTLSAFLVDPDQRELSIGVRESRRRHLAGIARQEKLDVDSHEVRTGSPYKIVFTKNNHRYEHARDRFNSHVEALVVLTSDPATNG